MFVVCGGVVGKLAVNELVWITFFTSCIEGVGRKVTILNDLI